MGCGRFAPTPSGDLHLGNLRTALLAWLFARSAGAAFVLRIEDLDPATRRPDVALRQLADLEALGLDWDGEPTWQSAHLDRHGEAIDALVDAGLTYPCYCSRREVHEAAVAAHDGSPAGAYPGTCRALTPTERAEREAAGRRPALRVRGDDVEVTIEDEVRGTYTGRVDDAVIRRADGTPAYNLAVVVDDAAEGVSQVVRGDDLLPSTPRQVHLARVLGLAVPSYAHVPLVLAADGTRLAKRHGAVTLSDRVAAGESPARVCGRLAESLGLARPDERSVRPEDLVERFDADALPLAPWTLDEALLHPR